MDTRQISNAGLFGWFELHVLPFLKEGPAMAQHLVQRPGLPVRFPPTDLVVNDLGSSILSEKYSILDYSCFDSTVR